MEMGRTDPRSLEELVLPRLQKYIGPETKRETPHVLYVESGQLKMDTTDTDFALATLDDSLRLIDQAQREFGNRIKAVLGIWVDDFGQDCSGKVCSVTKPKPSFSNQFKDLPQEVRKAILAQNFMSEQKVLVTAERSAKNRALRRLRDNIKKIHPNFTIEPENHQGGRKTVSYIGEQDNHVPVAFINGELWTVKCAAIVAQHYRDIQELLRKRFRNLQSTTLTDQSEMKDRMKVTWGNEIAMREINSADQIINVFYESPAGEIKLVHHLEASDFKEAA